MDAGEFDVVTGAFGYTGKYIARRLLAQGRCVKTLTQRARPEEAWSRSISAAPLAFDDPNALTEGLRGATTLYNTYWVRFPRGGVTFERAVQNTRVLVRAALEAGVRRIVHISITSPSPDSPLPYFRGKGVLEEFIADSGLSYALLRPTVIFGDEDILINNIAWLLRRWPVFGIPGAGGYRLQPVFVEDVARLAVELGGVRSNEIVDAVGPDVFTFEALVRLLAERVGSSAKIVHMPPWLALSLARLAGWIVGDVVLTRDELAGLRGDLLVSRAPPTCSTRLCDWLVDNTDRIGRRYASELRRHYRRPD